MDALQVGQLTVSYGRRQVFEDVSFSVRQGESLIISGLSGCGKTSLALALCGLIPRAVPGRLSGSVRFAGHSSGDMTPQMMAQAIGLVFQDADSQLICTQVEDELAFGLENLCVPPDDIRRRVDAMLHRFGLWDLRHENPARLSGGQKRLVCLASVLILEPSVLILDEPMANLDSDGRALVRQTIDELIAEGRTLIMIEHDLQTVTWADRWLILANGRVAALDTPRNLLADPARLISLELWFDGGAR